MKKKVYKQKTKTTVAKEAALAYVSPTKISIHQILNMDEARLAEPIKRIEAFRKGMRKKSFDKLKEVSGLDYNTLASALAVSTKTLQRKQIFDVVQSEKMYELAELYAMGISYFGEVGFRNWMERPLFSLGNRKPIELIDVSEGMAILKTEIMRLQHGISV